MANISTGLGIAFAGACLGLSFGLGAGLVSGARDALNVHKEATLAREVDKSSIRQLIKHRDLERYMQEFKNFIAVRDNIQNTMAEYKRHDSPMSHRTLDRLLDDVRYSPIYERDRHVGTMRSLIDISINKISDSRLDDVQVLKTQRCALLNKTCNGTPTCSTYELLSDLIFEMDDRYIL